MNVKSGSQLFLLAGLLLAGLVSAQPPAISPVPTQPGVGFAMVGIAPGESLRIVALNMGYTLPPSQMPHCRVALQLYDSQGQLLKEKAVADLAPGNAAMLDLSRGDLPGNDRAEIRGVLQYGYSGGANPPASILNQSACNLLPSLEVFDNHTGRTSLVITDAKALPNPVVPAQ